jgi:MFS superfamily sulfate permease-like transporter
MSYRVRDRLSALVSEHPLPPRLVVLFMGNVPHVDLAGVEFLTDCAESYRRAGIEFRLAEVHGEVREALRRVGAAHASELAEATRTVDLVLTKWRAEATAIG